MSDNHGIQTLLDATVKHWGENDGDALGLLFTEDASLINPFGQRADGRDAVAAMYRTFFANGMLLHGTTTSIEVQSLRETSNDVAFLDATQSIYGPEGTILLVLHLSALLCRVESMWRFADARPYQAASAPVSA